MIQRDKTFREWLKKERLKTEKSQRKKGNSGTPPQNQREISSRDKNSKRPRVKEIFKTWTILTHFERFWFKKDQFRDSDILPSLREFIFSREFKFGFFNRPIRWRDTMQLIDLKLKYNFQEIPNLMKIKLKNERLVVRFWIQRNRKDKKLTLVPIFEYLYWKYMLFFRTMRPKKASWVRKMAR